MSILGVAPSDPWFVSVLGLSASALGFLLSSLQAFRCEASRLTRRTWLGIALGFLAGTAAPAHLGAQAHGLAFPLAAFVSMSGLGLVFSLLAGGAIRWRAENHVGFRWVLSGFWLLFIASMLELSEAAGLFPAMPGGAQQIVLVVKAGGVLSLSVGFYRWLPMIGDLEMTRSALERQKARLEDEVRLRTDDLTREVAERRQAQVAAQCSNEAKSKFLANMSHELRTPLNAIIGFSDLLTAPAGNALDRCKVQDYARDINESGRHLLDILNDVLDLAKIEAGRMEVAAEPIRFGQAIRSAVRISHGRAVERGISMAFEEQDEIEVRGDMRAVRQVLINFLSNAVKFTAAGGTITIALKRDGDFAEARVSDTGCGIDPDKIESVFEPFEQVDNAYARAQGGTGLGLAISRRLATLMGGFVRLESELGRGTTAVLRLPLLERNTLAECRISDSA